MLPKNTGDDELRPQTTLLRIMQSPFKHLDNFLTLNRYPLAQVNRSLQAWDAADEYIINYLNDNQLLAEDKKILIFNDSFGALTCSLAGFELTTITDSYVAEQGIRNNLNENDIDTDKISIVSSLTSLPTNVDIILYKLPKNNALLSEQLIKLKNSYAESVVFVAAGKAKEIHSSTLKLFEKYLGNTTTSLAVKKARLIFSKLDSSTSHQNPQPSEWLLPASEILIRNHANVFARDKLDIGACAFIEHLPEIRAQQKVIDLGCGNGVIGLSILAKQSQAYITFVDESYMAVASAKMNVEHNFPESAIHSQFVVGDCLSQQPSNSADTILCNPPFHQQNAVTDHIAWQMFKDSFRVLKKGGELRIVGNRQLGYHIKLKRIFGNSKLVASNKKFVILSAVKKS